MKLGFGSGQVYEDILEFMPDLTSLVASASMGPFSGNELEPDFGDVVFFDFGVEVRQFESSSGMADGFALSMCVNDKVEICYCKVSCGLH